MPKNKRKQEERKDIRKCSWPDMHGIERQGHSRVGFWPIVRCEGRARQD
jgi:hypothetical protein